MTDAAPKKRGPDPIYTEELAERVLSLMASGKTILEIEAMEGMPSRTTIWRWQQDPAFLERYARADRLRCDVVAAELLAIADSPLVGEEEKLQLLGVMKRPGDDGHTGGPDAIVLPDAQLVVTEVKRSDNVARSKLMVDVRLRLLKAWVPEVWGDKVAVDNKHSGAVGFSLTINDKPKGAA